MSNHHLEMTNLAPTVSDLDKQAEGQTSQQQENPLNKFHSMMQKRMKCVIVSLFVLIILAIGGTIYLIFTLLSFFFSWVGAIMIFMLCIWSVIRLAIRMVIFPGSSKFYRRQLEFHYCQQMATHVLEKVQECRYATEIMLHQSLEMDKMEVVHEAIVSARRMVEAIEHSLTQEKRILGSISND